MARPDVGRGLALHTREPLSAALGKTQQLETLNRLSLVLTSTLDQAKVFEAVVRTATELFGDVASSLWVVNREGTELTLVADAGLRHPESRARRTLRVGEGLVGRLAQERRPVLLDDVQQDLTRVNSAMAKAEGFHAAASVPLLFGDRCFGALIVRRRTYEVFRPEDVDLLITLGNHAAFAIENGRLHEARELRASRLRTLAELNRIISSSLNADDVLRRIAEAAADLTDVRWSPSGSPMRPPGCCASACAWILASPAISLVRQFDTAKAVQAGSPSIVVPSTCRTSIATTVCWLRNGSRP